MDRIEQTAKMPDALEAQLKAMQQWEYGYAIYDKGMLEPRRDGGMEGLDQDELRHFLEQAGGLGWEMCGVLPSPTRRTEPEGSDVVVFKRPAEG